MLCFHASGARTVDGCVRPWYIQKGRVCPLSQGLLLYKLRLAFYFFTPEGFRSLLSHRHITFVTEACFYHILSSKAQRQSPS